MDDKDEQARLEQAKPLARLAILLFGGYLYVYHVSTHDTWMRWRRVRDGWWARKIDSIMNYE